jgi:hypothetical protein
VIQLSLDRDELLGLMHDSLESLALGRASQGAGGTPFRRHALAGAHDRWRRVRGRDDDRGSGDHRGWHQARPRPAPRRDRERHGLCGAPATSPHDDGWDSGGSRPALASATRSPLETNWSVRLLDLSMVQGLESGHELGLVDQPIMVITAAGLTAEIVSGGHPCLARTVRTGTRGPASTAGSRRGIGASRGRLHRGRCRWRCNPSRWPCGAAPSRRRPR